MRKHPSRQQGRVLLTVSINNFGSPSGVTLKQTSGFKLLDQAAEKAVWTWFFQPAEHEGRTIPTEIEVPILFTIK
jgi:protein TonB